MQNVQSEAGRGSHPTGSNPRKRSRVFMRRPPARWYAIVVGAFLAIRALSTLVAGASFATPGDGWRAVFQLFVAAALLLALSTRFSTARTDFAVGVLYVLVTVLGLVDGHDVLGVIPVDSRDKVVHPLIAVSGLAVGLRERWQMMAAADR
jgi:hypothetical protein